jgi:hypothetical protein
VCHWVDGKARLTFHDVGRGRPRSTSHMKKQSVAPAPFAPPLCTAEVEVHPIRPWCVSSHAGGVVKLFGATFTPFNALPALVTSTRQGPQTPNPLAARSQTRCPQLCSSYFASSYLSQL